MWFSLKNVNLGSKMNLIQPNYKSQWRSYFRDYVINNLPQLTELDGQKIEKSERLKAAQQKEKAEKSVLEERNVSWKFIHQPKPNFVQVLPLFWAKIFKSIWDACETACVTPKISLIEDWMSFPVKRFSWRFGFYRWFFDGWVFQSVTEIFQ